MINFIWFFMIAIGFVFAVLNGRIEITTQAVINSSVEAVELCMGLIGIMALWMGVMKIAERAEILNILSKFISPIMHLIFPSIPKNHPAFFPMVMNITANMFGLGNVATPFGLKAMEELQKLNKNKDKASNEMCTFLVLNTGAIQLLPVSILSLRAAYGAKDPTDILPVIIFSSIVTNIGGLVVVKLLERLTLFKT